MSEAVQIALMVVVFGVFVGSFACGVCWAFVCWALILRRARMPRDERPSSWVTLVEPQWLRWMKINRVVMVVSLLAMMLMLYTWGDKT